MAPQLQKESTPHEYQLKAVFLYNFTQFVEWPANVFLEENTPLVIGILGKDPFGSYLDETVQGEKLNEHPLVVQRFKRLEDIKTCHILFVNTAEKNVLNKVSAQAYAKHILTVGDTEVFAQQGGMIRFFSEKSKIKISVNLEATKNAALTVSSKLLRVAETTP